MSKNYEKFYADLKGLDSRGFVTGKDITPESFYKPRTDEIRAAIRRWFKPVTGDTGIHSSELASALSDLLGRVHPNPDGIVRGDVGNGEAILAMYLEGYRMKRLYTGATFNVSLSQVRALQLYNHPEKSEGNVSKIYWKVLAVDQAFGDRYDLGRGGVLVKMDSKSN